MNPHLETSRSPLGSSPAHTWALRALLVRAALLLVMGIILGALGMLGWQEYTTSSDPIPWIFYVLWPMLLCSMGVVPAIVSLVVYAGLKRRRKWAWYFAFVLGALDCASCFLPVGVLLIVNLLKSEARPT